MTRTLGIRRRIVVIVVLVALFSVLALAIGRAVVGPAQTPVTILTGTGGLPGNAAGTELTGCYTDFIYGDLVTDPTYGTAVIEHRPAGSDPSPRFPVMWLPGRTGRVSGSEVEILDRSGSVIARTGQAWQIEGGFYSAKDVRVWVACGYVLSLSAAP